MEQKSKIQEIKDWIARSTLLKLMVIFILTLLLLIPTSFVEDLIRDRMQYKTEIENEISASWGGQQSLAGPYLTVPYRVQRENAEGEIVTYQKNAHFIPETLKIDGDLKTTTRYKSIYEVILYNSKLRIEGEFKRPDFVKSGIYYDKIDWEKAYISFMISDQAGINENIFLKWGENKIEFQSGLPNTDNGSTGFHTTVPLESMQESIAFSMDLDIDGYKSLSFLPIGRENIVSLRSPWPDPGFVGNFIPNEKTITDNGFEAKWKIFHLSRNIPPYWLGKKTWTDESKFGVYLVELVDEYQKNMRSSKYAFLIICLIFLAFFLTEVIQGSRIHPFQYIMAGFALIVFYVLLLSISEHTGFDLAYLISSLLTIGLVVFYISAIFQQKKMTWLMGGLLIVIYGFIYIILQLQEYSLLVGAIGIFIALAVTMTLTRKINWYQNTSSS